ncbi:MAG TPA: NmrA family NAD(P)-binding protein [Steroidobacteraceae bacterium]|jgi:NAD(P)H dehydrogenase (quinone)|nr:NmrA family NAD(P)-binding protein [Steroidobacteraceae bacterium]
MIFVSGANGHFARAVIRNVLTAGRASSLIVGTRDVTTAFAQELLAQGVDVRAADFRRPDLMRKALSGVEAALFIPTYDSNDLRLRQNLNALEAAAQVGVKHVVYASFVGAESPHVEHSRLVHLPTEQALRQSGLAFTVLRHALYAEILVGDLRETLASGTLRRPGAHSRCAYIGREDLGISAAQILLRNRPSGRTYTETMERTWSGVDIAALMSEVFARPVRFESVPAADWPRYMTEHWGVPPALARSAQGTMQAIEAGEFDVVSPDYQQITGWPPRSMQEFLEGVRDAAPP